MARRGDVDRRGGRGWRRRGEKARPEAPLAGRSGQAGGGGAGPREAWESWRREARASGGGRPGGLNGGGEPELRAGRRSAGNVREDKTKEEIEDGAGGEREKWKKEIKF